MTDENFQGFRFTSLDARRYDFGNALRGYDRARVDQFRDQVAEELERLARVNQEIEQKARNFHEQLKSFRERDKALNEALVSAQQLRGEIREQAEREAQLIVREAQQEAERQLAGVRDEVARAQQELQGLWRRRRAYVSQLRHQLERQLAEINSVEQEPIPDFTLPRTADGDTEPPVARELRQLPPRNITPTPSWLDAVVEEER
ncbi:DivIVA domain-containing protein [Gemmatimonas sp.]|uniref:DivIVA domain-containing protein n=1 Tax=Gemmatimonas sp. TaxID=1962908 RepID=UPI0022BD5E87|nr:DivIVA domain-containing protein [Gemmatimonas sp.]MCZ8204613.1 DivIVA domain-containing protein [Gemmatimonas sp.]